jgi:hypothetical protein
MTDIEDTNGEAAAPRGVPLPGIEHTLGWAPAAGLTDAEAARWLKALETRVGKAEARKLVGDALALLRERFGLINRLLGL